MFCPAGARWLGAGGEQTQARDREARLCSLAIEGHPGTQPAKGQWPWALSVS